MGYTNRMDIPAYVRKRVEHLRHEIAHHEYLYYVRNKPEISDGDFDALMKELKEWESRYPDLVTPDSPTQRVGGTLREGAVPVRHAVPMLSLENAYSFEDLLEWHNRNAGLAGEAFQPSYVAEMKIDGLSISLLYVNGILTRAATEALEAMIASGEIKGGMAATRCGAIYAAAPTAMMVVAMVGAITAFFAATIALVQNDIKRILAYSTISQLGYMFLALGVGAAASAIFHLFTHAFFKALLFLAAGAVMHAMAGCVDLRKLSGLRSQLKLTHWLFLVGALALAGVPPFAGFWSKLLIIIAAVQAKHFIWAFVAILVSIITLVYFMKFYKMAFLGKLNESFAKIKEVPVFMSLPLIILALLGTIMGILLLPALKELIIQPAADVIYSGVNYVQTVLGG